MNISPVSNNQRANFGASYRVYFRTSGNERILNKKNMSKCLHILQGHLNRSKSYRGKYDEGLIDFFQKHDPDYKANPYIRVVPNLTKKNPGYLTIVTGKDAKYVDEHYGSDIGLAKGASLEILGTTDSFEANESVKRYRWRAAKYADNHAIFSNGKRVYIDAIFDPVRYKKGKSEGDLKGFEFKSIGFYPIPEFLNKNI